MLKEHRSQTKGVPNGQSCNSLSKRNNVVIELIKYISMNPTDINFVFILFYIFYFILLYNTVLVLPYINMNPPWVYTYSQSWSLLPPPSPYHLSGSSQCTSSKHPVSCIEPRLAIPFLYDIIHVYSIFLNNPNSSPNNACGLTCYFDKWSPFFRCETWHFGLWVVFPCFTPKG